MFSFGQKDASEPIRMVTVPYLEHTTTMEPGIRLRLATRSFPILIPVGTELTYVAASGEDVAEPEMQGARPLQLGSDQYRLTRDPGDSAAGVLELIDAASAP